MADHRGHAGVDPAAEGAEGRHIGQQAGASEHQVGAALNGAGTSAGIQAAVSHTRAVASSRPDMAHLRASLGLSRERMGHLMDVSAKTIERWEQSGALPTGRLQLQLLAEIQRIVALGLEVYTPEGLAQFMKAPLPTFQYRTALQMIEQGHGDIVYAALAADYEGLGY